MNYEDIKNYDIANGEGVRISLFVSGCTHHCKGCFNQQTWDPNSGKPYDKSVEEEIVKLVSREGIRGLTLLGGDPLDFDNPEKLLPLVKRVKEKLGKSVWCYTGDTLENIIKENNINKLKLLEYIDVLVDGPFIQELHKPRLKFKGSTNQRLIDVSKTLSEYKKTNNLIIFLY